MVNCLWNITWLTKPGLIPMTTCTVERSFSQMKLVKTRLRNHLGDETLDMLMKISIEGPKTLEDEKLYRHMETKTNQED